MTLSIARARRLLPVLFFIILYFIYRFSNKTYARDEIHVLGEPCSCRGYFGYWHDSSCEWANTFLSQNEIRICQTPGCANLVAGRFVRMDTVRGIRTEVCGLCWSKAETSIAATKVVFRETMTPDGPVFSTEHWHNHHRAGKAELGADGLWHVVPDEGPFNCPPISEWPGQ